MKYKIIFTITVSSIAMFFLTLNSSSVCKTTSQGAPYGVTGAPNESDCAKSGCHGGSQVFNGGGALKIDFNNGINKYEAGKTYPITIELAQKDIERFGFEFVALNNSTEESIGKLIATDTLKMQLMNGKKDLSNREYITYRYLGTEAVKTGLGRWTFLWQAPNDLSNDVSFYFATVAANDDGTDSGDWVYKSNLTIQAKK